MSSNVKNISDEEVLEAVLAFENGIQNRYSKEALTINMLFSTRLERSGMIIAQTERAQKHFKCYPCIFIVCTN